MRGTWSNFLSENCTGGLSFLGSYTISLRTNRKAAGLPIARVKDLSPIPRRECHCRGICATHKINDGTSQGMCLITNRGKRAYIAVTLLFHQRLGEKLDNWLSSNVIRICSFMELQNM